LYLENIVTVELDFKEALRIDMERKGFSEATLGKALGISQQAIHKWVERGFPPLSRLDALLSVLGPDSEVGKMDKAKIYNNRSRTAVAAPALAAFSRDKYADIKEYAERQEMNFANMLPRDLSVNVHRVAKVGDTVVRFDYLSNKLVVELLVVKGDSTNRNTSAAMLRLLTYLRGHEDRTAVLLVISKEDRPLPPLTVAAANSYGVLVRRADDGVEAARQIANMEGVTGPGFKYVMEPDDE
jgi:transcriptional regulator with XRE-family HTH domain